MASTLNVNRIGSKVSTLTIGEAGGDTVLDGNTIRADILKDSGGNVIFQSDGAGTLSNVNSGFGSALVLIDSQTASSDASLSFTSGITSTYGEYIFKFYNMNPETDLAHFSFQVNASDDEGGGYDTSLISSTHFNAEHKEQPTRSTQLAYQASFDLPQSASFQRLVQETGNDADETCVGELHLFNPSSTTYVKHFIAVTTTSGDYARHGFTGGYINDTTAITQVQFKFSSGDFDGTIKLWGVK